MGDSFYKLFTIKSIIIKNYLKMIEKDIDIDKIIEKLLEVRGQKPGKLVNL